MSKPIQRILLVEDDQAVAKLLEFNLTAEGHEVIRVRDGKEALRLYNPLNIDLIITDLLMPGMQGFQLIQNLRMINPSAKIIAISGAPDPDLLEAAKLLGADRILTKPFSKEDLLAMAQSLRAERNN